MIDGENLWLRIFVSLLNCVGILGCISIIYTYAKVPRLRHNPGQMILALFIL
jgi:hypothetical protein